MNEDHFLAVFGFFAILAIAFTGFTIERKLDRIIRLLELANEELHKRGL